MGIPLKTWCLGVVPGLVIAATAAMAYNPDPPRDPRAEGLTPIWAGSRGNEIVRVDRWPDGAPRRCVRAARLDTPAGGGPSRVEFGVERASPNAPDVTMYFRIQYLDGPGGSPLAVRDPVMAIRLAGAEDIWRAEPLPGGWFRGAKSAAQSERSGRRGFITEVEKTGNEFVSTFPDGSHRLHFVRGGVSFWHFNMFVDCVCALTAGLPKSTTDGFLCD